MSCVFFFCDFVFYASLVAPLETPKYACSCGSVRLLQPTGSYYKCTPYGVLRSKTSSLYNIDTIATILISSSRSNLTLLAGPGSRCQNSCISHGDPLRGIVERWLIGRPATRGPVPQGQWCLQFKRGRRARLRPRWCPKEEYGVPVGA